MVATSRLLQIDPKWTLIRSEPLSFEQAQVMVRQMAASSVQKLS